MPNGQGYFFEDQAYPEQNPFAAAQAMGLPLGQMMGGGQQYPDYDLNALAEQLGITYNQYQGYPNKIVPDQVMDIYGPTPDYLLPQLYNILNPDAERFDNDAFFGADPLLQGPLAEAHAQSAGDPIDMFAYLQSNQEGENGEPGFQDRLRQEIGRTEWDELAARGDLRSIGAVGGEEKDDAALDYYMRGLEDLLATGAPTSQRAESQLDYTRQREGFRPGPGTGQQQPMYQGPGFASGGGSDEALGALAQSPQYQSGGPQGRPGIDYSATPQPSPFGEGLTEVGADEGPDRLDYEGTQRFAVIGGRRFALPETMEDTFGRNPYYTRQLGRVQNERGRREFEASGYQRPQRRGGGNRNRGNGGGRPWWQGAGILSF